MLASSLPLSLLDIYSLFMSSLKCQVLCIVINFLVMWSICLSSSLDHFKNGPNNLKRTTVRVFIPFRRFFYAEFVSRSFLVRPRYFFLVVSFISTYLLCLLPIFRSSCKFHFSERFDSFLIWQFYSFRYLSFSTFHYKHTPVLCQISSLYPKCIFSLLLPVFPIHFHFCKQLDLFHVHKVIDLFL